MEGLTGLGEGADDLRLIAPFGVFGKLRGRTFGVQNVFEDFGVVVLGVAVVFHDLRIL